MLNVIFIILDLFPSYSLRLLSTGRVGGPAPSGNVPQLAGKLLEHDPDGRSRRPRRQARAARAHGHAHRRLPALHSEHLRSHPLHPSHLGGGHCWRYTRIPDCACLLLYGELLLYF